MTTVATKVFGLIWRLKARRMPLRWRPVQRVLLSGSAEFLRSIARESAQSGRGAVEFVKVMLENPSGATPVSGAASAELLAAEALRTGAREVAIHWPDAPTREIVTAVGVLNEAGLSVNVFSRRFSSVLEHLPVGGKRPREYPHLEFAARRTSGLAATLKRGIDLVLGALMLAAVAPLWALLVPVLLIAQGSPVLFRQERIGRGGRRFTMYKFRTMRRRAKWPSESELDALNSRRGPMFKAPNDPRVTRLGRWLRRFCIDETPQIINVLRGEMSLVGARPPLPSEVACYEPWQRARLAGHMGMTGLWQVSDRARLDFDDVVCLDSYYNTSASVLLDLRILAETLAAILSGRVAS